jgi:hypothetical protein
MNLKKFFLLLVFFPSWIRIRIPNPDPDPLTRLNPDPIRIRIRICNPARYGIFLPILRISGSGSYFSHDADPDPTFTLMRTRIRLLKVMRICNHWSKDPPRVHCEPPCLHFETSIASLINFESQQLLNFDIVADSHHRIRSILH